MLEHEENEPEEDELWVEGDDGTLVEGEVDNGGGGR